MWMFPCFGSWGEREKAVRKEYFFYVGRRSCGDRAVGREMIGWFGEFIWVAGISF